MTDTRFIALKDVENRTSLSTSTIYEKMKKNEFPKQIKIGLRRVAWVEAEINEWIADQLAAAKAA